MLPAWMLYATAVGLLACAGAVAIEHMFGIWGLPRRFIWAVAMATTIAVPARFATRSPPRVARVVRNTAAGSRVAPRTVMGGSLGRASLRLQAYRLSRRFERPARTLWIAGAVIVALVFGAAVMSMRRQRRAWHDSKLYGHTITVTDNLGPAVVGFINPRIVIPAWALDLPARERRFMLDHELEHLLAGDARLLLFTAIVLVLCPWNVALWWMARRLRVAIEIDCDARVIHTSDAPDEYGLFLVAVGERRTHGLFLAASLAERRSSLARRIHAMTTLRPRRPLLASIPFAAIALGAVTLAAQTPQPPVIAGSTGDVIRAGVMMRTPANRISLNVDQVRNLIAAHHPEVLAGTSEDNSATIILASNGEYVASGTSKMATGDVVAVGALRATSAPAATAAPVGGVGAVVRADPVRIATGVAFVQSTTESGQPRMMNFAGVGSVDPSLVQDIYFTSYEAGQVSVNALRVRFVVLNGNSVK